MEFGLYQTKWIVRNKLKTCPCIVRRTEQLRIGLTDDNISMLHLNTIKTGSKTEREISHMENF